ncbi:MAG: hypothetical protein KJZ84_22925 [Bryobacteraceae bacterium]|nr:hypothetical protein [Bryobacteraceae bacterium]
MTRIILSALLGALAAPAAEPPPLANNTEFRVRLLAPVSTSANQKGDKISAQVLSPPAFAGSIMEGEVRESKSGAKLKGTSTLALAFQTIHLKDETKLDIRSDVKSFINSQGKADVDEEGHIFQKKNNLGKVAAASGLGALIGGIAGGGRGAAIGAGVGAAASLIVVQMAAKAPNITFDSGSELVLDVSPRAKR